MILNGTTQKHTDVVPRGEGLTDQETSKGSDFLPRLCFAGPMLGTNSGWVLSQGEILADLFTRAGYQVRLTSRFPNRIRRLVDTMVSLVRWRREIDAVIVMVFSGPAFFIADATTWMAKRLGIPVVVTLHGGNLPIFSSRHPTWVERVITRGDRLISPSGYLAHFFSSWGYQVDVIPNVLFIEDYPFKLRSKIDPRLLWMRTFEDIYYPEMAIDVLSELKHDYPGASLTMAGQDRGLLSSVRHLAEERGLSESVRFPGFLNMAGKQHEFSTHDIFINTNRVDNMPVSVVEAAAFGLPVVATAVGGLPYLLKDGETGLLVENEDFLGMAKAVRRLLIEPALVENLSANGRRLAESCAWPQVRQRWEHVFQELFA